MKSCQEKEKHLKKQICVTIFQILHWEHIIFKGQNHCGAVFLECKVLCVQGKVPVIFKEGVHTDWRCRKKWCCLYFHVQKKKKCHSLFCWLSYPSPTPQNGISSQILSEEGSYLSRDHVYIVTTTFNAANIPHRKTQKGRKIHQSDCDCNLPKVTPEIFLTEYAPHSAQ